jgi:hypothetical protein
VDFVGVGAADFVGVGTGFAVGVAGGVGVGVALGVGAAMTSGDGTDAGELTTAVLAGATLAIFGTELEALVALLGWLTRKLDVAPADDGWLLVHAARAATQRTATTELASVGLVVRSRLAMEPG